MTGFEPATFRPQNGRATKLRYTPWCLCLAVLLQKGLGTLRRNRVDRTPDFQAPNLTAYRLRIFRKSSLLCAWRDSNPHCTDFKSAASCHWATSAGRLLTMLVILSLQPVPLIGLEPILREEAHFECTAYANSAIGACTFALLSCSTTVHHRIRCCQAKIAGSSTPYGDEPYG